MPITCRSPNGCLAIASYEEQPATASKCVSMKRWRALRYGETALLPFCYSPGLRDGIYIVWNRYPQRVLNGTAATSIPGELLWPSYYGTDGLRLKDDDGRMFFPFGASTVYRGLKEASLTRDSKAGAVRQCPSAIQELVATMDREAEATSLCNAHLAQAANGATSKSGGTRLSINSDLSKIRSVGGDVQLSKAANAKSTGQPWERSGRRSLQTTHGMVAATTHMTHFVPPTPAPTTPGRTNLRVNSNANNVKLSLLGSGGSSDGGSPGHSVGLSTNLNRLSSGLRVNNGNGNGNNNGNDEGTKQSRSSVFSGLANANWFSGANLRENYDPVDGRGPDGDGGVDKRNMVGLRDLPAEEIIRICHAIDTRTTAIPHGTSLVTMDFQQFAKFSCGSEGGLFPVRTDDDSADSSADAKRTDSVVSFTPTNVDPGPFQGSAASQKGEKPWLARMPLPEEVGPLLLEREIIRVKGLAAGDTAAQRRFFQSKTNLDYFRDNMVHSHLKLMPIATHTLFERKEVFALVLAALGGFFALILAGGRMLALLWLHCTRAAPGKKKGKKGKGAAAAGSANGGGRTTAHSSAGRRLHKQHQSSAVELLAVDPGSSRSVPVLSENPMLRRGVTASAV